MFIALRMYSTNKFVKFFSYTSRSFDFKDNFYKKCVINQLSVSDLEFQKFSIGLRILCSIEDPG